MSDVESAVKRPQPWNEVWPIGNAAARFSNSNPSVPTMAPSSSRPPQHVSSAGAPAYSYNRSVPDYICCALRACYRCSDLTHLVWNFSFRLDVYEASDNSRAASANARDMSTANTSSDTLSVEASSRSSRGLDNGRVDLVVYVINRLTVPPTRLSTVGSWAFPVVGPQTWNNLPEDVTSADSLSTFRRLLKTHGKSFPDYMLDINWLSLVDLAVVPLLRPP